jgi:hypothetical protein
MQMTPARRFALEYRLESLTFARYRGSDALREVVTALKTRDSVILHEKRAALVMQINRLNREIGEIQRLLAD